MKLWECIYEVSTGYNILSVRDYIWSTSEPTAESIGHYWRSLFPSYTVNLGGVREAVYHDGMNLDARVLSVGYVGI
jgi:hypothetical protein